MYKIHLINMPFAALDSPSLALTQLKSVLDSELGKQVSVQIFYLNHDFARYIGVDLYQYISISIESYTSGLGEWFLRQSAFPESLDNSSDYLLRYYRGQDEQTKMLKRLIQEKRAGADSFLDELIAKYHLDQAELVGFTSLSSQNVAGFAMARKLKARVPDIVTVMGGAGCEAPMGHEIARSVRAVDYVFCGPALESFPEFVRHCLNQETELCKNIRGVVCKSNYASVHSDISASGEDLDIDVRPELNYEEFLDTLAANFPGGEVKPTLWFETSRGCAWGQCAFCGLNGLRRKHRRMSAENALEQFKYLFRYSTRCSQFCSVDNLMPGNYLDKVFPFLDVPANATILYAVRADLSEEQVQILSRANVKVIQPGIEALATSSLELMKKGTTVFQNLLLLKLCCQYGVYPYWNLLVGFPGEGEDTYKKYVHDIPLLTHFPPPTGVYPIRFDRYSTYFRHPEKYELDLQPYDFYKLVYPFSQESLVNLAYYFTNLNYGAEYLALGKWFSKIGEKVKSWQQQWSNQMPPKLFYKEHGQAAVVSDSRSGKVVERHIDEVGKELLDHLAKPVTLSGLHAELSHISNFDPVKEISYLQSLGLVFQEGEYFMSLVLPDDPPTMSFVTAQSEPKEKAVENVQSSRPETIDD